MLAKIDTNSKANLEEMLAKMDTIKEKIDSDREERKQEIRSGQEHLKEEMKAQMAFLIGWMPSVRG
jgi:hypothetical protein